MLSSYSFFLSFKLHYFTFFFCLISCYKTHIHFVLYVHSEHHCYVCYCAVDTLLNQQLFCSRNSFSYFELAWRSRSLKYLNLVPVYFWPLNTYAAEVTQYKCFIWFISLYALFIFLTWMSLPIPFSTIFLLLDRVWNGSRYNYTSFLINF